LKSLVATILIILALLLGAGFGYLAHAVSGSVSTLTSLTTTTASKTITETAVTTYTIATSLSVLNTTDGIISQNYGLMRCVETEYDAVFEGIGSEVTTTAVFANTTSLFLMPKSVRTPRLL